MPKPLGPNEGLGGPKMIPRRSTGPGAAPAQQRDRPWPPTHTGLMQPGRGVASRERMAAGIPMLSGDESVRAGLVDVAEPLARQMERHLLDDLTQRYAAVSDIEFSGSGLAFPSAWWRVPRRPGSGGAPPGAAR
jgi:hypothetical protein